MDFRQRIRNLTVLMGSPVTILANTILAPGLPRMAKAFQDVPDSDFLIRLTLTLPALFIAFSAPLAGLLLDRVGRRPIIIGSLILYGISGSMGFFLHNLQAIMLSRAFLGMAGAGIMIGMTTLITDYFSGSQRNRFLGYQGASIAIGSMLGLLTAGFLADINWRLPFLIYAYAFVILIGVFYSIDEPVDSPKNRPLAQERDPFPYKAVWVPYAAGMTGIFIVYVFPVQLPFLMRDLNASSAQVSLALSAQTFVSIFTSLKFESLKARFSFRSIFIMAFIALGIDHILIAVTSSFALSLGAMMIGGLGLGMLPPNAIAMLTKTTSDDVRGRVLGGMTMAFFIGPFLAPLITQPLARIVGIPNIFLLTGIFSLFIAILFLRPKRMSQDVRDS